MKTIEGRTLDAVLPLLGAAYKDWKTWGDAKDCYRDEFFALADQALERQGLAMKTVTVALADEAAARARAALHNPGWTIISTRPCATVPDAHDVLIQENPSLKAFSVIHDGVRFTRSSSVGATMIDDEWLLAEDPELYLKITYELPWGERIVVPLQHLPTQLLAGLERYIYAAAPRVQLRPPRPVKEGEE